MILLIAAYALLLQSAAAVFADEAWTVDYHHALLGEPQESTTFFHRPNPESKASLIYTLSEQDVLGAVNPRDGSIVWRQLLSRNASSSAVPALKSPAFLRAADGGDVAFSGVGNRVEAWSAADGRLAWTHSAAAELTDLELFVFSEGRQEKDVLAMVGEPQPSVKRLDGETGALKWEYKIDTSDVPYQISASATSVYAILLHKTMLGYLKIKVISLDPVTGSKTDEYTLSSDSELASSDTIVSVGANSASPIIAWTDAAYSTLKINVIGTKNVAAFNIEQSSSRPVTSVKLHAPYHANSLAHFLVHYQTATEDWAEVFHVNLKTNKIEKAYGLPKIAERSAFSTSTIDANVYFTRITKSQIMTVSSASHGVLARWSVSTFGTMSHQEGPDPEHAVAEVSVKGDTVSAVRCAVWLSSGELVLLRDGVPVWQRPEALSDIVAATFATAASTETLVRDLELEAHSNPVQAYFHRVKRHLNDLIALPEVLRSLPQRFVNGFLGTNTDGRDSFGFHQIAVCATRKGRLIALDVGAAGKVLWSKRVVDPSSAETWKPRLESLTEGVVRVTDECDNTTISIVADTGATPAAAPQSQKETAKGTVQFHRRDGGLEASAVDQPGTGPLWTFTPQEGERIISMVPRPVNDPVASIGIVLGNRDVLYKYLSPNLAVVVTGNDARGTMSFHVLDTVSGSIEYSNTHAAVDLSGPIASALSENWFAYSFTAAASDVKGHQLIVGELFESLSSNDRGLLEASTNSSSFASNVVPFVLTQTYHTSEPISRMAVTRTRQGITSRQLLAVLPESQAIVGIPRGVIDPRRPVNRDPTKDEQMEGLARYSPTLEFDPKWYLSHQREVLGVQDVITSPALVESTSLVFAHGLDVFGTRLSPSFGFDTLGKDFNKFQMLATVGALAVATFVVAPLVSRPWSSGSRE